MQKEERTFKILHATLDSGINVISLSSLLLTQKMAEHYHYSLVIWLSGEL